MRMQNKLDSLTCITVHCEEATDARSRALKALFNAPVTKNGLFSFQESGKFYVLQVRLARVLESTVVKPEFDSYDPLPSLMVKPTSISRQNWRADGPPFFLQWIERAL